MITYMALAPSDITEWLPGTECVLSITLLSSSRAAIDFTYSAVWFKVAEAGKAADGTWASTTGLTATDSIYTFTVPATLKPGQYIVRHEM